MMLGLLPSTTGNYRLAPWFHSVPGLKDSVTLPQYLTSQGFLTAATGMNYGPGIGGATDGKPEFDLTFLIGRVGTRPPHMLIPPLPMGNNERPR